MNLQKLNTFFLSIIVLFILIFSFYYAQNIIQPLVIALLFSFILSPIVSKLRKLRVPEFIAIFLVILLVFGFCYLVWLFIYSSFNSFVRAYPKYEEKAIEIFTDMSIKYLEPLNLDSARLLRTIDWTRTLKTFLITWSGSFMDFIGALGLVLIFLIFLLLEKNHFKIKLYKAFKNETSKKIGEILEHINNQIGRYHAVKFFVSLLTGFLVWLTAKIIGLDFAALWGIMAFFLNFIPNIGSFFVVIFTIFIAFIQFYPGFGRTIAVIVFMSLIQIVVGNFIEPKLQGQRLNLSPFFIILSLVFWGWLWGVVGMLLAVPIIVSIKIISANIPSLIPISIMLEAGHRQK